MVSMAAGLFARKSVTIGFAASSFVAIDTGSSTKENLDVRILFLALVCTLAVLASVATTAQAAFIKPPPGYPVLLPHEGTTSGDWEAVFGLRKVRSRATALVKRIRRLGFRCAVIEHEKHAYEVAVIGLRSRAS